MHTYANHTSPLAAEAASLGIPGGSYTPIPVGLAHGNLVSGSGLSGVMDCDMNTWSLIMEEPFANVVQSETSTDAELQVLVGHIDQPGEQHTGNDEANAMPTLSAPSANTSSQLPAPEAPSLDPHALPIITSEHQSYLCSWYLDDLDIQCGHVAPDRPAFLRHLGAKHQVSGGTDATITCQLLHSKTDSVCRVPIRRGCFPRHVDTHYPLRYHCQECPPGTSFSRQDSWKKHMINKHA